MQSARMTRPLLHLLLPLLLLLAPSMGSSIQVVSQDSAPVLVELFYESFCPGCRAFITTMLYPAFDKLKDTGIMEVRLWPYGNAHESQKPDGSWEFKCQHGKDECLGNLLEVCAMAHMNWDSNLYLPVISCMEGADSPVAAAKGCLSALSDIPYKAVKTCAWGAEGNALMHEVANRTDSLSPSHNYVPWVVVQGQHTDDLEREAMNDLVGMVCGLYQGAKPVQCNSRMAASNVFIEKEWREQTKIKQKEMEEVKDNTSCILCKYVISTLDGMLEDKANEKEIKAALETLCSFLPASLTKQCDTFVETYTDIKIGRAHV